MIHNRWIPLLTSLALAAGCLNESADGPANIRAALLASAKASDPDFPDGRDLLLTHFSYVGDLTTSRGEVIYVADQRAVIAGMMSPRGRNGILFFNEDFQFLGKIAYVSSRPLWCDGGKLYLFGDLDGFATGFSGNVIDVTNGYDDLRVDHAPVYGSSGDDSH